MARNRAALNIWMNGEKVATWTQHSDDQSELRYLPDWLASEHARPLSLSLPFTPGNQPHRGGVVRNYFDNLLPDNPAIRRRLALKYRAPSEGTYDLLSETGRDCVGAIQLLPEQQTPDGIHQIQGKRLDEAGVERVLKAVVHTPALGQRTDDADLRISIAGAQEKTALLRHRGHWHIPSNATPSTHIFKLPLGLIGNGDIDFSTSVENEWLCAQILSAYEIPVAACKIERFGDQKALVVERFDRRLSSDKSWWIRLPQEDFCQALGVSPLQKYEADGGPGISRILDVLRSSSQRELDRRNFYRAQILFWMLAATDGHAKNFSIFHEAGGGYHMTPLYDVMSAWPVAGNGAGKLSSQRLKLAMAVHGANTHYRIGEIQRRHWNQMARSCGLGLDAEELIAELTDRTPAVIAKVESNLPAAFPQNISAPILAGLRRSAELLTKMPAHAATRHR